jgi:DNA invertase Pin-like site-specific DNA recombinase
MTTFYSYLRVSTQGQGQSGLGLEAQRRTVAEYIAGCDGELLGEFVEVESGRKAQRSELDKALKICKREGARLVVAKLDRLSRDAHFLLGLQKARVDFLCCDMPSANALTIGIMALVAQEEAFMVSTRTKAALKSAKERGIILGEHGKVIAAENKANAHSFALTIAPIMAELKSSGITSYRRMADELNQRHVPTYSGTGKWHVKSLQRINSYLVQAA